MTVTLFTDASAQGEKCGYAYWARSEKGRIKRSGLCPSIIEADANHGELFAIIVGIRDLRHLWPETDVVIVRTDSRYAIRRIQKKQGSVHPDLIKSFDSVSKGVKVIPTWIKGHRPVRSKKTYINNWCDKASRNVWREDRIVQEYQSL